MSSNESWRPSATDSSLKARANVLRQIRKFFEARDVTEVDVPVLGATAALDPHVASVPCQLLGRQYYLQSSPEYFLKRLLSAGMGSIYYLGKSFRHDPLGARHNPEFTMLEWYREAYTDAMLVKEVIALLKCLSPSLNVHTTSYRTLFIDAFEVDPHLSGVEELAKLALSRIELHASSKESKSFWLDLLFSHCIEPSLVDPTVVIDFPAEQCALARVEPDDDGVMVAKRFEFYWRGLELANGYWELTDSCEQKRRFLSDIEDRKKLGMAELPLDDKLLAALDHGMPACAGVAMGVDRLLMCLFGEEDIRSQISFSFDSL